MCQVRFIGCLHLGHKWMAQHRGFNDEFYHDEHLIEQWNKVVHKKDLTYILGDVTMESSEHYYQLDRLKGRKIVVLGNHDLHQHTRKLLEYVETVAGVVDYKGFMLTHVPIHPNEISFCRGNIHAHIHENELSEVEVPERYGDWIGIEPPVKSGTLNKYYNVDAFKIGFKPKTLIELDPRFKTDENI
jgi:calcineurin-like phosphoesterase family protein